MRTRRRATIEDLRAAIQALPRTTRVAMLDGIRANDIIVGAYSDERGICPMLAAHRAGGRTNLISFAKAWDHFALGGANGARVLRPRPATARELLVLRTHLEASLLDDELPQSDLAAAIVEHRELVARREDATRQHTGSTPQDTRPGDRDRSKELGGRPGWSWTRLVRRYDEYQWALEQARSYEQVRSGDEAEDRTRLVPV